MSVICYSDEEIRQLIKGTKFHQAAIQKVLAYSPHYSHFFEMGKLCGENLDIDDFLECLISYCVIANRIAYAVQYREPMLLDIKIDYKKTDNQYCTHQWLYQKLGSLEFNMATSGGTVFLEKKWTEPLDDIYHWLLRELIVKKN